MSFSFAQPRRARRPNLMPMIDVVLLLLVFFMLAARFSVENVLPIGLPSSGAADYSGPPRLVDIGPTATMINGRFVAETDLALAVATLTDSFDDAIVLRARPGADLSRIVAVVEHLSAAGFTQLVLVE